MAVRGGLTCHGEAADWVDTFGKQGVVPGHVELEGLLNHKQSTVGDKKDVKNRQSYKELLK